MFETQKTNAIRGSKFIVKYLTGKLIDIGAGNDLVCEWAERFDIEDGDANHILQHRAASSYDAVHSSHCLEHMHDPEAALKQWWDLLKPGGFLVVVVPDEDLYEQGMWPSRFNGDHKVTFRLDSDASWSPVSHDIRKLVSALPNCRVISAERQDQGYDYRLKMPFGAVIRNIRGYRRLRVYAKRVPVLGNHVEGWLERFGVRLGMPVDQTGKCAVAQIQVVAQRT